MRFKDSKIGKIPAHWDVIKLGEVANILSGYAFKSFDFVDKGIPVVKIKNIIPPSVNLDDVQFVSENLAYEKSKYRLKYNDILISLTGSNVNQMASAVGKVGRVRFKNKNLLLNQRVGKVFVDKEDLYDESFLFNYLSTEQTRYLLASSAGGSANQANISPKQIKELLLPYPPISEQRYIGKFLDLIDEKIELNQQIISNLDQMAQTIFKHWFVDFEFPNEHGQPYKSSGGSMVESQFGEIPMNWALYQLKEISKLLKNTFNPKKTSEEHVMHFSLPAFDSNQIPVLDQVKEIKSNKWILEDSCVVFSKMNPQTPRVWLTDVQEGIVNVTSSEFVILKNDSKSLNAFIYNLCKSDMFTEFLIANATGSTNSRQRVTPTIALQFKLPLELELVKKYGDLTSPLMEQIKNLRREIIKLQQLRDAVLPGLLSGEIEISDEMVVH